MMADTAEVTQFNCLTYGTSEFPNRPQNSWPESEAKIMNY